MVRLEAGNEVVQSSGDALAQPLVGGVGWEPFEPYGKVCGGGLLEDRLSSDGLQ